MNMLSVSRWQLRINFLLLSCYIPLIASAEISLSSNHISLDRNNNTYAITQDLGVTSGNNLLHSFHAFNIGQGEIARFSGADTIENVIARVTGGGASTIDGMIRNTIPDADTFLINPAGIIFGENARLDVQGGFHASTADSLKFADGAEVHVDPAKHSTFSSAAPEAFGFLDSNQGKIQSQQAHLSVAERQVLAFTAQHIALQGSALPSDNIRGITPTSEAAATILHAPQGTLQLSAANTGDIPLDTTDWRAHGGAIRADESWLNVSGNGGGNIRLRAADITISASRLESETKGDAAGGAVDIRGHNANLINGTDIFTRTFAAGHGSEVKIHADDKVFLGGRDEFGKGGDIIATSQPQSYTQADMNSTGNGGNITITGKTVHISDGVEIQTSSFGIGKAGDLSLRAEADVIFDNPLSDTTRRTFIRANAHGFLPDSATGGDVLFAGQNIYIRDAIAIEALTDKDDVIGRMTFRARENFVMENPEHNNAPDIVNNFTAITSRVLAASTGGKGSLIRVEANNARFDNGAAIRNQTFGIGDAGDTQIELSGTLTMQGADKNGRPARLVTVSDGDTGVPEVGNAGRIEIHAERLDMRDGAHIKSSVEGGTSGFGGNGGEIIVNIRDEARLSGVNPHGEYEGGFATGIYANSTGLSGAVGTAGKISVRAKNVTLENGAQIRSATNNSAPGGEINLHAQDNLHIRGDSSGRIVKEPRNDQLHMLKHEIPEGYNNAQSGIYSTSDSLGVGGQGGTIKVSASAVTLGEKSRISSTSKGGGHAGQIQLDAACLSLSHDAAIISESNYATAYTAQDIDARDKTLLAVGDVIEVTDADSALKKRYLKTEQGLLGIMPVFRVATTAELDNLKNTYALKDERVVRVDDAGHGKPAYYWYKTGGYQAQAYWIKIDEQPTVFLDTLEQYTAMNLDRWFEVGEEPPLPSGTVIRIEQGLLGKPTFIFFQAKEFGAEGAFVGDAELLKHTEAASLDELRQFTANTFVSNETLVFVGAQSTPYIYFNGAWFALDKPLPLDDFKASRQAQVVNPGAIVALADGSRFIRAPHGWLPLAKTYHLRNLAERDALSPQAGDFSSVADSGDGTPGKFFYADGQWHEQFRGGNAGEIQIHANTLNINHDSRLSTASTSGGGGTIQIDASGLVNLRNSTLSSSVQEGAGNGGNITINAQFLLQNRSPITARAYEGQGGNIAIDTKGIYQFEPRHASPIDASSQFGVSGAIQLDTPEEDLTGRAFIVSGQFLQSGGLSLEQCQRINDIHNISRLRMHFAADGLGKSPANFQE